MRAANSFVNRPLLQVVRWISVVAAFAVIAGIGVKINQVGNVITASIVVFALFYVVIAILLIASISRQQKACAVDVAEFEKRSLRAIRNLPINDDSSILRKLVFLVDQMIRRGGVVNSNELLQPWASSYYEKCDRIAAAATMLPVAGLLGTVLGMMGSLSGIAAGVDSGGDLEVIVKSLQDALSGMSLAFTTTLVASFLGGVVLSRLVVIARCSIRHLLTQVQAYIGLVDFSDIDDPEEEEDDDCDEETPSR